MEGSAALSGWFPERVPTWTDVAIGLLAVVWVALTLSMFETISWELATAGFVAFAVALGPITNSSIGRRLESWSRAMGLVGRATVIVLFAVGVWATGQIIDVPTTLVTSFVAGGMFSTAVFVILHVLYAGGVSGWRPS